MNDDAFAKMKPTACLINCSRGPIVDTDAGVWVGGGFFVELADTVVFTAVSGSFSNDFLSGTGVVVKRSYSVDDTVCVEGVGCFSGSEPDIVSTQEEFFQSGLGPVGYDYLYSYTDGFTYQQTSQAAVGLVATSLRGDTGVFDTEQEESTGEEE